MENQFSVNDFFCGAGGMGLGFKQAGFTIQGAWDWDEYAVLSYKANVDEKVRMVDIKTLTGVDVPHANVWTFGFPCQDISVGGKRQGMVKGVTRSGMFYEIMRLLEETDPSTKPEIILAENVKKVDELLPEIKKEFAEQGYRMYARLFNSKDWSVPQQRERYFIVGVRNDLSQDFTFPDKPVETVSKLESVLDDVVDDRYFLTPQKEKLILERYDPSYVPTSPRIVKVGNVNPSGRGMNGNVYCSKGICPTLTTNKGEGLKIITKGRARRLTPRECARLQAFPESFTLEVSNYQLYLQFGNAVTVTIAKALAKEIKRFLTINSLRR